MFHKKPTEKQIIGKIGEDFACDYLRKAGFSIVDRNYLRKWGEIDVVAKKVSNLHFVEVKTVSRDTLWNNIAKNGDNIQNVTHETDTYRPEDNIHPWKLQRMSRVIQSYLLDKNVSDETNWQFDVITIYLDKDKRLLKIEFLDYIVL